MSILAIDQGTSGTKAVVVDHDGGVVATAEVPVRPVYLDGGGVEQNPAELLNSVLAAGRRAVAAAGRPVVAVALANQGETVLAWDPTTGQPRSVAIVWQDRRAEVVCAGLRDHAGWVAERTGLQLDPYFSAPKMAWLRRQQPPGEREGVVTTTDAWLVHHLTGELVTDVTTASRSLLLDLDTVDWDPELTALFGLEGETLPRVVGCDEIVGTTRAFGPEVPVAGLIVDQQAALLAEGCLEPGSAKCTYGTGAFLLVNTGTRAVRSATGLTSSVAWRARGQTPYCLDGQVYTAASAVRWLTELGLISGAADLDGLLTPDEAGGAGSATGSSATGSSATGPTSGGVLFVPALAGLAAPWWRPDAGGAFLGMTLATRPEHLVRATVEGIAAQVAELVAVASGELGAPLTRLRVDGGLTRSAALMQAQADLLQLPVDLYPSADATALGAAALARLALDPDLDLATAVGGWTPARTYTPRWPADRAEAFMARWRAAVTATLEVATPQ